MATTYDADVRLQLPTMLFGDQLIEGTGVVVGVVDDNSLIPECVLQRRADRV
jgi:hypothetical protein